MAYTECPELEHKVTRDAVQITTEAVHIATRRRTPRHDAALPGDPYAKQRLRQRVSIDRRTRQGRAWCELEASLLGLLRHPPSPWERVWIDRAIAYVMRSQTPDMKRAPERSVGMINAAMRILSELGISLGGANNISAKPISMREQMLANLMESE